MSLIEVEAAAREHLLLEQEKREVHAFWQAQARRTHPARRNVAEEALRGFYESVGLLGPLRRVVWVDSFSTFAGATQAVAKDYCWLVLNSFLPETTSDHWGGRGWLREYFPEERLTVGYQRIDGDEWEEGDVEADDAGTYGEAEEEESFVYYRAQKAWRHDLVPRAYDGKAWAELHLAAAHRVVSQTSPRFWAMRALRECVAFFPGPGVAVCGEFPAAIEEYPDSGFEGSFTQVRFRNGETYRLSPWGPISESRDWSALRHWKTLPAHKIVEFPAAIRDPLLERVGARRVAEALSFADLFALEDRELRRRLIDAHRVLEFATKCTQSQAAPELVDHDACGELWRIVLPEEEDYQYVQVTNSTAEPDGTFKKYYLRVPPDVETAQAAVAWTFDMSVDEYEPLVET